MAYVLSLLPTRVCAPVAVTVALSPSMMPSIVASALVSGAPSYSFSPDPVVIVTGAFVTVSVPFFRVILVKFAVRSSPSAFRIANPSAIGFSDAPASIWLPVAVATIVKSSGRPVAVTSGAVSALPSYTFSLLGAANTISASLIVTASVPSISVTS